MDWNYYKERLGSAVQKIITIPAAMQRVPNPVPRIQHPDWLHKKVAEKEDAYKQTKITNLLAKNVKKKGIDNDIDGDSELVRSHRVGDVEDIGVTKQRTEFDDGSMPAVGIASSTAHNQAICIESDHGNVVDRFPRKRNGGMGDISENTVPDHPAATQPSRQSSFGEWLDAKKLLWRNARLARKRRIDGRGPQCRRSKMRVTHGVDSMFAQQAISLASATWQVVSLTETEEPGVLKAWVVIQGRMHAVKIKIPRTFFVDMSSPSLDPLIRDIGSLVKRTLPEGSDGLYTYKIVLDEALFRKFLPVLEGIAASSEVRGVYEGQISPLWNAAVAMGCLATVDPFKAPGRSLGDIFELPDIRPRSIVESSEGYFNQDGALGHMMLHISEDKVRGRGVIALHLPMYRTCKFVLVNPASRGQREINPPLLEKYWREARDHILDDLQGEAGTDVSSSPKMDIVYSRSFEKALKLLGKELTKIVDRALGANVLLINAPNLDSLRRKLPALNDVAWAEMKLSKDDEYPTLGWQIHAARLAIERIVSAPNWLRLRLQASRYAHLPLASIGQDWILDACDALLARQLREANHLLWTRDDSQPDLSSRPNDVAEALLLHEGDHRIELACSGAYRCVCLEVKVSHLAVCAVLEASSLGEMEGSALLEENRTFKLLRTLAQNWVEDATRRHNICADTLLRNMYRWICSPTSCMYNPSLKAVVQNLMRKLLLQLVAELKRLGTVVVYADTSTLIIATGRHSMVGAIGYVDYVLETLRRKELFQWLALSPSRAWHTLLFADRYNYLGLVAPLPEDLVTAMSQRPGDISAGKQASDGSTPLNQASGELAVTEASLKNPEFDFVLNMRDYLPGALHNAFMSAIGEFVWMPWRESTMKALAAAREAADMGESSAENGPSLGADGDLAGLLKVQHEWLAAALPTRFTDKLLRAVKYIVMHVSPHDGREDHQFPRLAGSYLTEAEMGTPALSFVRGVCRLYSLDTSLSEEVTLLRRQLLRLIHVKEFGAEASWRDPCKTVILPDIICPVCQDCQDLDLCRDPALQRHDWSCGACGAQRDVRTVEARLVAYLRSIQDAYLTQDLRCQKCWTVTTEHLQCRCDVCSGQIQTSVNAEVAQRLVKVLKNIARYHGMHVLQELAEISLPNV